MWISVAIISVALVVFILKYVFTTPGPNPFETDTREPLKKMVHDRKVKNKVLKQGELNVRGRNLILIQLQANIFKLKICCL